MAIDQQNQEQADYLADKLGKLLKEGQEISGRTENRSFYLQVAQFVMTGVVATILGVYGTIIHDRQEQQDQDIKKAQLEYERQLDLIKQRTQEEETRATKAKVIMEFMPALADTQSSARAQIGLEAIRQFIDIDFAKSITVIVGTPALKEGFLQIQNQVQSQVVASAPQMSALPAPGGKTGWVYLGIYDSTWRKQYFEFPADTAPSELIKSTIAVKRDIALANFRSLPPESAERLDAKTIVGQVNVNDKLEVLDVRPVPTAPHLWWANVRLVGK